jgi:hypothetical protein
MSAHFSKAYWNPAALQIFIITGGSAHRIRCGSEAYTLVDLEGNWALEMHDARYLLLFDKSGNLLDQLVCSVLSLPLHRSWYLSAEPFSEPCDDGTQVVIRLSRWRNSEGIDDYVIAHDGLRHKFPWSGAVREDVRREGNDLCRLAIADRKFKVLFPKAESGTLKPSKLEPETEN